MSRDGERRMRGRGAPASVAVACAILLAGVTVLAAQSQATLPADTGSDVVRAKCLGCHEADLIVQQRLARPGWVRELDKMERWGAVLTAAEKNTAADYLARHFPAVRSGEPAAPAAGVPDAGKATLEQRCLGCHGVDLVEQQRLDRAGWGRELDKMVRWGATIPAADRDALTTYLTTRYGRTR
ncbi:MAG: hypothetical protein U0Q55_21620 [Vicinamibacterales bacterium]